MRQGKRILMVNEMQKGYLFVIVGPGGAGKNTLMNDVLEQMSHLSQLATATTRPKRPGEVDGKERHFLTPEQFKEMIENKQLLEYQEVTKDRFYGIPRASVENKINQGEDLIADIDVKGAETLRQTYNDNIVVVFVNVPGNTTDEQLSILRERMEERNEDPDVIKQRLSRAQTIELPFIPKSDYVIVNDEQHHAVQQLIDIITEVRKNRELNKDTV